MIVFYGIYFVSFIRSFRLGFGIVSTVWYVLWRSVLLMGETGIPGENHPPVVKSLTHLSHNVESSTSRHERDSNSQYKW
jgi:hypothetical protein